jgi:flavin reductase (DIM6/NTAB) family NADH-FMN oxidoreductase RutF
MTNEPHHDARNDALQNALRPFTSSVETSLYIATTGAPDGEIAGCLVGFATQCSILPPRFLVCLSNENHTYRVAAHSNCLALHLLGEDEVDLASVFAEETGDSFDKFASCRWHRGETGAPILDDAASWVEGLILRRFDVGDHQASLLDPVDAGGRRTRVLTFQRAPSFRPGHPIPE